MLVPVIAELSKLDGVDSIKVEARSTAPKIGTVVERGTTLMPERGDRGGLRHVRRPECVVRAGGVRGVVLEYHSGVPVRRCAGSGSGIVARW